MHEVQPGSAAESAKVSRYRLGPDVGAQGAPLLPMALSRTEKFAWPEIAVVCHDEGGITFESYGSGPPAALIAPSALIGAGFAAWQYTRYQAAAEPAILRRPPIVPRPPK